MQIDILTIFPEMFKGPFSDSIIKRAIDKKIVKINIHNLRKWTTDKHQSVDDRPYGGGAGMVMRVDVIDRAVRDIKNKKLNSRIILLDTKAGFYSQKKAQSLIKYEQIILIASHYEGIDHRVHDHIVDDVISIGPYVLTGGEIPVIVIVDSIVRLIPDVIKQKSLDEESYTVKKSAYLLEYPQYTRPAIYKGWQVPEILLHGDHPQINQWRKKASRKVKFKP